MGMGNRLWLFFAKILFQGSGVFIVIAQTYTLIKVIRIWYIRWLDSPHWGHFQLIDCIHLCRSISTCEDVTMIMSSPSYIEIKVKSFFCSTEEASLSRNVRVVIFRSSRVDWHTTVKKNMWEMWRSVFPQSVLSFSLTKRNSDPNHYLLFSQTAPSLQTKSQVIKIPGLSECWD